MPPPPAPVARWVTTCHLGSKNSATGAAALVWVFVTTVSHLEEGGREGERGDFNYLPQRSKGMEIEQS